MKSRLFKTRAGAELKVSEMGFGAAPLGDLFELIDERVAFDTLRTAHEAGVTLFDASPHYGNGLAEARCGTALRGLARNSFVFSTKVGRVMHPFEPPAPKDPNVYSPGFLGGYPHGSKFDYSYDGAMRSVEQSLLRTGLSSIDVLLIHDVDVWTHGDNYEKCFAEEMGGAYKALDELRRTGFTKAIGVGVNESEVATRFATEGDFDTVLLAGRYSLLEQPALKTFMPLAVRKNIGVILGGVFNSGILATGAVPGAKYDYAPASPEIMERVRRIEAVCARHGTPLRRAALAFALAHPAVISVIIGAVKPAEPRSNAAELAQPIPAALWADLKSEGHLAQDAAVPA
jgi:D-threo-aldose 1-dehydrogenase